MKNKILPPLVVFVLLLNSFLIGVLFYTNTSTHKMGYVHNDKLILDFKGFRENQAEYQAMTKLMQANLDTISSRFNAEVKAYVDQKSTLSQKDKTLKEAELQQQESELLKYKQAIEQKAEEKEASMNEAVFKQINSLVKEYALENDYDAIVGVTESGNVLFAKESHDITDEVVRYINNKYEGN